MKDESMAGWIRGVRSYIGQTQREFAENFGVQTITIRSWESGRRTPGMAAQKILAQLSKVK